MNHLCACRVVVVNLTRALPMTQCYPGRKPLVICSVLVRTGQRQDEQQRKPECQGRPGHCHLQQRNPSEINSFTFLHIFLTLRGVDTVSRAVAQITIIARFVLIPDYHYSLPTTGIIMALNSRPYAPLFST